MEHDTQLSVRIPSRLLKALDEIRRGQDDLPTRPEIIRRMLEDGAKVWLKRIKREAQEHAGQ